jgi:protein tyrosine phosphatase (PTP) superfamily phosphohydrolase (DUF442 family)
MEISKITDQLFIGTTPVVDDYDQLRDLGVKLVINMRLERPPRRDPHNPPMKSLWLPTLDSPLFPMPMGALQRGVHAALQVMAQDGKVFVHCAAGVHRAVAQAAAILIAQGVPVDAAMAQIKARRKVADPDIWYIRRRIQRFAEVWGSEGD